MSTDGCFDARVLSHHFEHVTTRKPEDGIRNIDNIAMDLAINGLPSMASCLGQTPVLSD